MGAEHPRDLELSRKELIMRAIPFLVIAFALLFAGCRVESVRGDLMIDPPIPPGGETQAVVDRFVD